MTLELGANDKFTKIKQYLLRSGIPLEGSIIKLIQKYKFVDNGEYFYARNGKIFSIDINALKWAEAFIYYRGNLIGLDLLIECKYREDNKKWFFMTFKQPEDYSFRAETNNIFIDFPFDKRFKEYGYLQKYNKKGYKEYYDKVYKDYFSSGLTKVHKGIEIYKDGFNEKAITEVIFQILFGLGSSVRDDVKLLCELPEEETSAGNYFWGELGYLIIPIIVTTAKLYVLNEEITIEDIKKAKNIEEISQIEKAVFYEQQEYKELSDYIKQIFNIKELMIKSNYFMQESIDDNIDSFASISPRILIINYEYFEEIISLLLNELNLYFKGLIKLWTKPIKKKKKR